MDGNENMLIGSGTQSSNIKKAKAKKKKLIVQEDGNSIEQSRQNSLKTIATKNNMSRTVIDEDLPGTTSITQNIQQKPEQDDEIKAMSEEKILLRIVSKKAL